MFVSSASIFRQICKILPKPIGLFVSVCLCVCVCVCVCLCVCVCVCVCVTIIVRTGRILAKIKNVKWTFVDFDICNRMGSLRKLYSVTLIYLLNVKIVE